MRIEATLLLWAAWAGIATAQPAGLAEWLALEPELVVVVVDGLRTDTVDATLPDGSPLMPTLAGLRARGLRFTDCLRGHPDPTRPWRDLEGIPVRLEPIPLPTTLPDAVWSATDPRPWHDGDRHATLEAARQERLETARLLWRQRERLRGRGARHGQDRAWLERAVHAAADRQLASLLADAGPVAVVVTAGAGDDPRVPLTWFLPGVPPGDVADPLTVALLPRWLDAIRQGETWAPPARRWSVDPDGTLTATTAAWSLSWRADGGHRLFDLTWDPDRRVDLAVDQTRAVATLSTEALGAFLGPPADGTWASAGLWPALAAGDLVPPRGAGVWDSGLLHPRVGP